MARPVEQVKRASNQLHAADKPADMTDLQLVEMYRQMVMVRQFDRRCIGLQRAGRIGTYPPCEGQEACQVGVAAALRPQDFLFPTYRDSGVVMLHGMPMENMLLYWNGRLEGAVIPEDVNVFPMAVPIATQLPHAVGAAWAAKLRGVDQVALGMFGDGASSEGDFHVAMNFAGVFHVPAVFVCQNNQYAISVPLHRQTATETIAEKAAAYGFEGIRVDGCDVLAVYRAVHEAVEKAARGEGPTLVEALTYRFGAHTTSDDPTKYRSKEETDLWRERDPIPRFAAQLRQWGLLDNEQEAAIQQEVDTTVSDAIAVMEAAPPADPEDMFLHIYKEPTPRMMRQQDALRSERARAAKRSDGSRDNAGKGASR